MAKSKYKESLAKWTAIVSFAIGWILVIINFFLPPIGDIANSTLWILGQSLLYTGAVIGIANYTTGKIYEIKREVGIEEKEDGEE